MAATFNLTEEFGIPLNPGVFDIDAKVTLYEGTPPGANPTSIIRTDQTWSVKFEWRTSGSLNAMMNAGGNWHLRIYLEQMGVGEFDVGAVVPLPAVVSFTAGPGSTDYSHTINVPAGVPAGVFRLVAIMTAVDAAGNPSAIACHGDGGIVQFYVPV